MGLFKFLFLMSIELMNCCNYQWLPWVFLFSFTFFFCCWSVWIFLLSCGSNSLCGSHQWNWIESILEYKFEHIIFNILCGLPCFALVFSIINFLFWSMIMLYSFLSSFHVASQNFYDYFVALIEVFWLLFMPTWTKLFWLDTFCPYSCPCSVSK